MADRKRRGAPKTSKTAKAAYLDPAFVTVGFAGFASDPEVNAKEIVFNQGDPADAVFYIETGGVQTHHRLRSGQGGCYCAPRTR